MNAVFSREIFPSKEMTVTQDWMQMQSEFFSGWPPALLYFAKNPRLPVHRLLVLWGRWASEVKGMCGLLWLFYLLGEPVHTHSYSRVEP